MTEYALGQALLWLLFLLRTLGFIVLAPVLSARGAPALARMGLACFLALISFIAWAPRGVAPAGWRLPASLGELLPVALNELLLGLLLGFLAALVFVAVQWAGSLIGYQMGFAVVNVLDPHSQSQVSIIGEFLFAVTMVLFLQLNLHHDVLRLWHQSYALAPPGAFSFSGISPALLGDLMQQLTLLGLQLAFPLLAFLLLADLALGILARIMPQMNVFIIGISLKIALGLLLLGAYVIGLDPAVHKLTQVFTSQAALWLRALAAGG